MERIEAFEQMLCNIQNQAAYEEEQMQKLKAAGKEKSATYRQFFGNCFFYKQMHKSECCGILNATNPKP